MTTSAESAATWVILKCVVTPSRIKDETPAAVQVVVGGTSRTKPGRRRRGGNSKEQRDAHNMTGDTSAENRVSNDDFYMFRQHREH